MSPLHDWMARARETDATLAEKLEISRVQVSRIRRAKSRPSLSVAVKLEGLTGIPAARFAQAEAA